MLIAKQWYIIFCLLLIGLCLTPPQQAHADAIQIGLHKLWDRDNHCFVLIPWDGPPDGSVIQSIETMVNDVFGAESPCIITDYGRSGPELPATCRANADYFVNTQTKDTYICNATGDNWISRPTSPGVGVGGTPSGLTINPTTGVESIHFNTITLTNTCGLLGATSHVNVIAGPEGQTCILPDASLFTTPGRYSIMVQDANRVTLAPSGMNILNGENAPLPSVKGPRGLLIAERRDDNTWLTQVFTSVGYGEPLTSVCTSYGGSTNTSSSGSGSWHTHTLNCLIPANSLTTGTQLKVCVGEQGVTGSTAPTVSWRLLANATVLLTNTTPLAMNNNLPASTAGTCFGIVVGSVPGETASVYAHRLVDFNSINLGTTSSSIATPVPVNTTVDVLLAWETQWHMAGVGTNSRTLNSFVVEGARFAN